MEQASLAIVLLGSRSDIDYGKTIAAAIQDLGIEAVIRIASAHRVVRHLLDMLEEYERANRPRVYITVAGRSNALSGVVDANTVAPVIACPPPSDKFGGMDILSTLRMPTGVAPMMVLEPGAAALAAGRILGLVDPEIHRRIASYQAKQRASAIEDDRAIAAQS
ncbi:MAG: AIR carboxylase family protein [Chloroflexota bacterium]